MSTGHVTHTPVRNGVKLMYSSLTGRIYVVTKWRDLAHLGEGRIEAITKFDVTDEAKFLVHEAESGT